MKSLKNLDEIIKIGLTYKNNWFRGHSKLYGELTPRVFRKEFSSGLHLIASNLNPEIHINEEFKRIAPSLHTTCPSPNDYLEWLILMQHYGTPTRLLDWTESILVSSFFAVSLDIKEDAEIWRLYPQKLNKSSVGYEGFPILNKDPSLLFLSSETNYIDINKLISELDLEKAPRSPIAFYPILSFPRITAQAGTFTIHPNPALGNSILDLQKDNPNHLSKYIIPANNKPQILSDLNSLGINYRTLYANLDGLSKDLCLKYSNPFWNIWGQPPED